MTMTNQDLRKHRGQQGLTLIELMVVVVILGILAGVAIAGVRSDPTVVDGATRLSHMIQETSRSAQAGGPIRPDVALANNQTARTQLRIFQSGSRQFVSIERVVEDAAPLTTFVWQELRRYQVHSTTQIFAFANAPDVDGGMTRTGLTGEHTISCFSDGSCEARTLYLADTKQREKSRVAIMPLAGAPMVLKNW